MSRLIRVLLVEDHDLVRAGIRSLLQNLPGIEVEAEAGTGRDASRTVEVHRPDVALMDIVLPDSNGLEVAAALVKQYPDTKIVILSMHSNEEYVWQALHAGARGYLLKNSSTSELELAIQAVARGESYLSPPESAGFHAAGTRLHTPGQGRAKFPGRTHTAPARNPGSGRPWLQHPADSE